MTSAAGNHPDNNNPEPSSLLQDEDVMANLEMC